MHPDNVLNEKVFLNSMSLLAKEVERFLVFNEIEKDKTQYKRAFIGALNRRNATKRFIHESDRFSTETCHQETIFWKELTDLILTQINLYYSDATPFQQQVGVTPLHDALHFLDIFHSLATLKIDVELQERAKKVQSTNDDSKRRLRIVKKNPSLYATYRLYHNWQYNVNGGRKNGFKVFRKAYEKNHHRIPTEDSHILWTYMLNQCSRFYQQGQVDMLAELLSLYKFGHQEKMLLHQEMITEIKFANIISVSIAGRDLHFAEVIREEYSKYLPKDAVTEGTVWAEAYILKYKERYKKAISLVDELTFKNHSFKPRSKVLRIQCFFEQFILREIDLDELLKACRAFERQMKKHYYLSSARSDAYLNFSKYLKKIARSYNDPNQSEHELKIIQVELEKTKGIQGKKWLLEKIESILGKGC